MKPVAVEARRGLIPTDLLNFRWVDEIVLGPSAGWLAYTVKRVDVPSNNYQTHLYVRELASGTVRCLTEGVGRASALAWSEDGERLAYTWSDDEGPCLRVWSVTSSNEVRYATPGQPLSGLDWSPDG